MAIHILSVKNCSGIYQNWTKKRPLVPFKWQRKNSISWNLHHLPYTVCHSNYYIHTVYWLILFELLHKPILCIFISPLTSNAMVLCIYLLVSCLLLFAKFFTETKIYFVCFLRISRTHKRTDFIALLIRVIKSDILKKGTTHRLY